MNAPDVKCRCCGKTMDAKFQPPLVARKPGYHLITCQNEACPLVGFTFSENLYAGIDLEPYLCKQPVKA